MNNASVLSSNLLLLRSRSEAYADLLSRAHERREKQERPECEARSLLGESPTDETERNAARSEAAAIVGPEARVYVSLRPGFSHLPFAILEAMALQKHGSVLLVIEDRLELLASAFSEVDWAPILTSTAAILLLGEPLQLIEEFLRAHPAIASLPFTLLAQSHDRNLAVDASFKHRLDECLQKGKKLLGDALVTTRNRLAARTEIPESIRVFLTSDDFGYLLAPLTDGLRAHGCTVSVHCENPRLPKHAYAHDILHAVLEVSPDLVLSANRPSVSSRARQELRELGIVTALWCIDSPPRMGLAKEDLSNVDVTFTFDDAYRPHLATAGAPSIAHLSVAAGLQPVPGCGPDDAIWPARRGPNVSFVGSHGASRIAMMLERLRRYDAGLLETLNSVALDASEPRTAFEARAGLPYDGAPCLFVDEVRSTRHRLKLLSPLRVLGLKIYGDVEWARTAPVIAACYAGQTLGYGIDLSSVYYNSLVNVNVFHNQCVNSTNSRVYDVLAAGGFLLTEYRPCLEREFDVGRHLVTFRTPEEALSKAAFFLDHPGERELVAREGQRHVLANHTFAHRSRRLLDLVLSNERPG